MPTYVPFIPIPIQLQDASGDNLTSGTLEFYESGTTTPTALYSDNAGTSIGTSITLNASGYPESGGNVITLFRDAEVAIKVVCKNSSGTVQWTADTLDGTLVALGSTSNGKGASLVGIEDTAGNLAATDVEAAIAEMYTDFMQNLSDDTTPSLGGNLACGDNDVERPILKDYAIEHATGSISSGAITFDFETANSYKVTLSENITSITISNPPPTGHVGQMRIVFLQDGTGSWTVGGWPAAVKWPGGTAPTVTTTATTGRTKVILETDDAGTLYEGNFSLDYS